MPMPRLVVTQDRAFMNLELQHFYGRCIFGAWFGGLSSSRPDTFFQKEEL